MPDTTPSVDPAAAELAYLRSRHVQFIDKFAGIPKPGICASDRHRWPCHAHLLGEALAKVLALADEAIPALSVAPADCTSACDSGSCDCSGQSRPVAWTLDPAKVREAITRELAKEARRGDGS